MSEFEIIDTNDANEELVITVPENTRRKLFLNGIESNLEEVTAVEVIPSAPNPFVNKTVYAGLCYICVSSIGRSYYGVKYATCIRTYHIKCILKHETCSNFNNYFICTVCSKATM